MATKAAKALKSRKTLSGDEIGNLKSVKASEMSSDIRCQNHAEKVALQKQVNVWYRDQYDSVRKLSKDQQHAFRNLIKFQNEKRRIQRQTYIQNQRVVQQKLREQAIRDREAAAKKFLESTLKKGQKNIIKRQKEKAALALEKITENEEGDEEVEANANESITNGSNNVLSVPSYGEVNKNFDHDAKLQAFSKENDPKNNVNEKQNSSGTSSVDSGIGSFDMVNSQQSLTLKSLIADHLQQSETLIGKQERRVTFVEEEGGINGDDRSTLDSGFGGEGRDRGDGGGGDLPKQPLSHHHVTVIDGDTGEIEILPREKTRIVDETAFLLRRAVGDLSLKQTRAHLRPSTVERQERERGGGDEVALATRRDDSDLDRILAVAGENDGSRALQQRRADGILTLSRTNTTSSILPSIREDVQGDMEGYDARLYTGKHDWSGRVGSNAISPQSPTGGDVLPAKTLPPSGDDEEDLQSVDENDEKSPGGEVDQEDDEEEERKKKSREKKIKEKRKLEDDMHKYHVGIANRTFKIPNYKVAPVSQVPVYTRNSEGSLVASEKTVRPTAANFKLPSRRQGYLIKKALQWEEAQGQLREKKLKEFLAKMKGLEQNLTLTTERANIASRREPFRTQKRDSISHNSLKSTVYGHALSTGSSMIYGENGVDANDLRNCRYIRQTSIDDTSSSLDESYESRRRKRAMEKVSSWGPLGVPHAGTSRSKKRTTRHYVSI